MGFLRKNHDGLEVQSAITNTKADGSLEINATIDTIRKGQIRDKETCCCGSILTLLHQTPHCTTPPPYPYHTHNLIPTPTPPPIPTPTPPPIPTPTPPPPIHETEPTPDEHIYEEQSPVHHHFSPPQEQAPSQMPMDDLLHEVPNEVSQEVKKLKGFLKRRREVGFDRFRGRRTEASRRNREEQVEDISPNTLEAAKTLSKVASLKSRSIDKGRRYKRRRETKSKKVVSSLDFQEDDTGAEKINTAGEINAASIEVNTASKVNTGSIELNTVIEQDSTAGENKGQREGKAPMLSEETPKKSKEQILQEEASLAEAIRKAQVQFEAQYYTNEDWDLIRAKLEANAELSKSMLGSELQGEDFAKRMVDIVNQRKKLFAEERAKAKRNKPMTQSQLKTYMMNYLKNQGTWKINQLKKLSFAEVKEEFDKLVKQIESFAPISFEATKASLKRFGEELQTKTPKRLKEDKDDESKEDESTKKSGKRRKQMARKGMNTSVDENDSEDSDKVGKHEESNTGTETPINPVPVAMKTPSVATYKIIKQGEKGVYQIVREDGTDIRIINFWCNAKSKQLAGKELSNPLIADDFSKSYGYQCSDPNADSPPLIEYSVEKSESDSHLNLNKWRKLGYFSCGTGNPIDDCWRCDPNWRRNRKRLADCGIGFGQNAIGGRDGRFYVVTDSRDDDPVNPRPGTLRHAVIQDAPLWIVFKRDMVIQLKQELIMNSFKTIDARGVNVHIANGACLTIQFVTNIIIHGLHIHDCKPTGNALVRSSPSHYGWRTMADGEAISIFGSSHIWVDHNSLSNCADGLVDAVMGSTAITISNNTSLITTRCRHGYFHVVNDYTHWEMYAIGGSADPTINSQGNRFTAPNNPFAKEEATEGQRFQPVRTEKEALITIDEVRLIGK
ncbi:probable pectate lyase 8 [Tanacetum coccineum]